jgi:hypothetical protein
MTDKRIFFLSHLEARKNAARCIAEAPAGWRVTVEPPKRNLEQNALLWVLLQAFADQLVWPVNGAMTKLSADEWKDILSAAYRRQGQRVAMGIDGGMVMLGARTSKMSKREFAEFLDFVHSVAADRGVELEEQACAQ